MAMQTSNSKPILAPIDFSPESKAALLFASSLSRQEGRPLVVLHVIHDDGRSDGPYKREREQSVILPLNEIAEHVMNEFISELRQEEPGDSALGSAKTMVVDGLPVTRIAEVARKIDAGHIVDEHDGPGGHAACSAGANRQHAGGRFRLV